MTALSPMSVTAYGSSTSTDICVHEWVWQSKDENTCQNICIKCNEMQAFASHMAYCDAQGTCYKCGYIGEIPTVMHVPESVWKHTEDTHWQECSNCGAVTYGPEVHYSYCQSPTVCAGCGYEGNNIESDHRDRIWENNGTEHWQKCLNCGQIISEPAPHFTYCSNPTLCVSCRYPGEISIILHANATTLWEHNDTEHWGVCSICSQEMENTRNSHTATCAAPNVCEECGATGIEATVHHSSTHREYSTTECWDVCDECGQETNGSRDAHWAECNNPRVCVNCGYEGDISNVSHMLEAEHQQYNDTDHWWECTACGQQVNMQSHSALCTDPTTCVTCGYVGNINQIDHPWSELTMEYDETRHWEFCSACNTKIAPENHYSKCTSPGYCAECMYQGDMEIRHTFQDGVCVLCGLAQPTPIPTEAPTPTQTPTEKPTAEPTQAPTQAPTEEPTIEPTQAPTQTPTEEPTTAPTQAPTHAPTEEPTMEAPTQAPTPTPTPVITQAPAEEEEEDNKTQTNDQSAATATPAPTATPEPVFTQAADDEVVHGVKVADKLPLTDAMLTVLNTITAENEHAQVQIANFDKLLTVEEAAIMTQMKPQEQLLTFLTVMGIQVHESDSLAQAQAEMSDEAKAAQEQIKQRLDGMSAAERTAFDAALAEYFPMETVVVDGEEYTWFTIDLEVWEGDTVRIERYGFRLEGDEWIFAKLEIAA